MIDWNNLISLHQAMLWRTAYRLLNHHDDALDCCQEALLDAYQLARQHNPNDWGAVLTCLVTRRAIDRLRERERRRRQAVPLNGMEPPANGTCPVQNAEASEILQRLRCLLAELPDKQAMVFWFSCMEGMSHDAIAQQLRISANESRVLLHRARAALEEGLQSIHSKG